MRKVRAIDGYLYLGELNTVFMIDTEDGDFYSVNYLHSGCLKVWCVVHRSEHGKVRLLIKDERAGTFVSFF